MTEQKKSPEISIIVPVYNVEKYLPECIESILVQTFTDFELILVEDGSPDGCPALCDAAAEKDGRIRVIHQKNGGLSAARNAGLDIARGEWIGFVDSDDYIAPEMYEKYLSRVISETERLHKLTESMLTLNSLDAKGFLSRTNFDINRVIKDTAASFEGTCDSRHIRFDLTFSDNIQMVYADMGKIQQVLYNLIDNAIKFSHDDSVIYIQASSKYEKIFVSVKDTGIGIPRDSIKKIWDRFYKTDLSRGKDKRGTGLGLSIVKEIIQAHGENIDVISTEGVGTEFIFSLPSSTSL